MTDVTLCTVFCNGVDALKLMWRSYYHHHKNYPVKFWCWDNDSTDGAEKYAADHAAKVFTQRPRGTHQDGLDHMCKICTTEFVCVVDFDVEFKDTFINKAIDILKANTNALCVAHPTSQKLNDDPFPVYEFGDFYGAYRIDPCCVLFRTKLINRILEKFSFGTYYDFGPRRLFYDVGAMVRNVAEIAGMDILEPSWVYDSVYHYGQIGALVGEHNIDQKFSEELIRRYETIKKQVSLYEEVPVDFGKA